MARTYLNEKLFTFDEDNQRYVEVYPYVLMENIIDDKGRNLVEILADVNKAVDKIKNALNNAPEHLDSFLEVSQELNKNKNSIDEIFRAIDKRVKMPKADGAKGQVLKLDGQGEVVFDDDKDTVYTHPKTHDASMIVEDKDHRFVSDVQIEDWDSKLDKDSSIGANPVSFDGATKPLQAGLEDLNRLIADIKGLIGRADGLAQLDGAGKVPSKQLPDEALRDTTYDLSSFAKSEDIEKDYAKTSSLTSLKEGMDEKLKGYVDVNGFDDFTSTYIAELDNREKTTNRGAVNGYASLGADGKVPDAQLPDVALRDYDLKPFARADDVARVYATKDEVVSVQLDYVAEDSSNKGKAGGYASLGDDGKVPANQLPSYVDDVMEYASKSSFPTSGERGKIYVDLATENIYRWSGSTYTEISPSLITEADVKKLEGIEAGAEKNNVTSAMINTWNNKWDSAKGKDLSSGNVKMSTDGSKWSTSANLRQLDWWIYDLHQRTMENRDNIKAKPGIKSLTQAEYDGLTTKTPNTLYLILE